MDSSDKSSVAIREFVLRNKDDISRREMLDGMRGTSPVKDRKDDRAEERAEEEKRDDNAREEKKIDLLGNIQDGIMSMAKSLDDFIDNYVTGTIIGAIGALSFFINPEGTLKVVARGIEFLADSVDAIGSLFRGEIKSTIEFVEDNLSILGTAVALAAAKFIGVGKILQFAGKAGLATGVGVARMGGAAASGGIASLGAKAMGVARVAGPIGAIISTIAGGVQGVKGGIEGYKDDGIMGAIEGFSKEFVSFLVTKPIDFLKNLMGSGLEYLGFTGVKEAISSFSIDEKFREGMKVAFGWLDKLFENPIKATKDLWKRVSGGAISVSGFISESVSKAFQWIKKYVANDVTRYLRIAWKGIVGAYENVGDWISSVVGSGLAWLSDKMDAGIVGEKLREVWNATVGIYTSIGDWISSTVRSGLVWLMDKFDMTGSMDKLREVWTAVVGSPSSIADWFKDTISSGLENFKLLMGMVDTSDMTEEEIANLEKKRDAIKDGLLSTIMAPINWVESLWEDIMASLPDGNAIKAALYNSLPQFLRETDAVRNALMGENPLSYGPGQYRDLESRVQDMRQNPDVDANALGAYEKRLYALGEAMGIASEDIAASLSGDENTQAAIAPILDSVKHTPDDIEGAISSAIAMQRNRIRITQEKLQEASRGRRTPLMEERASSLREDLERQRNGLNRLLESQNALETPSSFSTEGSSAATSGLREITREIREYRMEGDANLAFAHGGNTVNNNNIQTRADKFTVNIQPSLGSSIPSGFGRTPTQ